MDSDNSPVSPATMQFEYDPERLIEEVKKRPGIWDYDDVNYRVTASRIELWNEVVRELLQPNVKVSRTEMRELVLQLQKKWKSVKDSFQKYIANPNRTKRPYIYYRHLQFMLKNSETGIEVGSEGGFSGSEDAPKRKKKRTWRTKKLVVVKNEESSDDDKAQYVDIEDGPTSNDGYDKPSTKEIKCKKPDEFAFASVNNVDASGEDCDKMFLLSLLPHLKSIPEELRLNAKMELLRVLHKANHQYGESVSDNCDLLA